MLKIFPAPQTKGQYGTLHSAHCTMLIVCFLNLKSLGFDIDYARTKITQFFRCFE